MKTQKLIDRKELIQRHPALGARPYRLHWLVKTRQIPFVLVGRRVYFDESIISEWIANQTHFRGMRGNGEI